MKRLSQLFFGLGFLPILFVVVFSILRRDLHLTGFQSMLSIAGPVVLALIFFFAGAAISGRVSAKEAAVVRATQPLAYAKLLSSAMASWDSDDGNRIVQMTLTFRFVTEKREIITVTTSMGVSLSLVHEYRAGKVYGIRYNPEDPHKIMLDDLVSPAELEAGRLRYIKVLYRISDEELEMRKEATRALGVIMESSPTGNIVNNCSEMALAVNVVKDSGDAFMLRTAKAVPKDFMEYTIPGNVLPIYYREGSEQEAILWFYDEKVGTE